MKSKKPISTAHAMSRNAGKAEAMLKQLANANRLMILCTLISGEKTVGELSDIVELSQSALSQHLAKLRQANLVGYQRRGQKVYYHICSMEAQAILSTLYLIYCK